MRIVVTGAYGFLGWHTSVRLRALTGYDVIRVGRSEWSRLPELIEGADAILHLAGVNRAPDDEVREGNIRLAEDVAAALRHVEREFVLVYANSIHAESDSPYGIGKRVASHILAEATEATGGVFKNVYLPNLFGEHGQPGYNSFVATFVDKVIKGEEPEVQDREVQLLHVQEASEALIDAIQDAKGLMRPSGTTTRVSTVLHALQDQFSYYHVGEIPKLPSRFSVDLFNTLRAAMFPARYPIPLTCHSDERGTLFEAVRAHGSEGQTFMSTSRPGVTRGQHFHLRKVERFVVVDGHARISLRRVFTNDVISFDVRGEKPVIVDMPTLWAHKIENAGERDLTTLFWTNELFDPMDADTYAEVV